MWIPMDWDYIAKKLKLKHKAVKKIPDKVSKNITDEKHIGSKQFETYTGLALLDEHGEMVHKSIFKAPFRLGVGNTLQVNWDIKVKE